MTTTRASLIISIAIAVGAVSTPALGGRVVGDLVYCDVDADGTFGLGDYPIDGVTVHVVCDDRHGTTCADVLTTTGTIHPSVPISRFASGCEGVATWDILDPADHAGRYAVDVGASGCPDEAYPFYCRISVDASTLPAGCNGLVTPRAGGFPADGNVDGDRCDLEDGPFPEGQPLGNLHVTTCEEHPDPAPSDGAYDMEHRDEWCALAYDFGYTPERVVTGISRTPGFWKTHPWAVEQFLPFEFCGEVVDQICEAVALLSTGGNGRGKRSKDPHGQFTRHAAAASLNCAAFGCDAEISDLIAEGSAACAAGADWSFGDAGDVLDVFNNSGTDLDSDLAQTGTAPHYCDGASGIISNVEDSGSGCRATPAGALVALAAVVLLLPRRRRLS